MTNEKLAQLVTDNLQIGVGEWSYEWLKNGKLVLSNYLRPYNEHGWAVGNVDFTVTLPARIGHWLGGFTVQFASYSYYWVDRMGLRDWVETDVSNDLEITIIPEILRSVSPV